MYMLKLIFFLISVKFCFSFVLNSLTYITIPKSNGKIKINFNIYVYESLQLFNKMMLNLCREA